ncbi:EamA family transporter RarD [Thalassococcus sp. BH17M4-6]|uniref:EamA family transporter RarD n=1 Tax=Thalassococcus sp. BH17M4-6 TaxID=3413148 RepID=UPI003BD824B1
MKEIRAGVMAMIGACTIWGLSPLYYKLLTHVPPFEVLAHRTLWSLVFFAVVLAVQRRLGALRLALSTGRSVALLALAGLLISANWFLFILSVQINRTTETSLGYYMFPLVAVLFGVVFFGERLGRAQRWAVALAVLAVLVLSVGLGVPPWISLTLASTFGLYGVIKKRLATGAVVSVTAEVLILSPLAVGWLWYQHGQGTASAFGHDLWTSGLLMLSGPLTAIPLILFSFASQRVALTTVGLLQYINPTLQFFCAVVVFGEPFGPVNAIAFALIWAALAIYSLASIRQERARRRASIAAAAPPQV